MWILRYKSIRRIGRNYDNLNNFGFLIVKKSKRVVDYYTCNRKCRMCDIERTLTNYDCKYNNFEGNAKMMEPNIAIKILIQNKILKD